jgi:hypothetical protein
VISENDICNELLFHWKEQDKPHLDDDEKCCYVLAVRAVNEIRRLRAEVEALRADAERYRAMRREGLITKRRGKWIVTWDEPDAQPTDSGIPFRENVDSAVDRLIAFHAECDSRYAARKGER